MVVSCTFPAEMLGMAAGGLIKLAPADIAIIAIYFVMVLGIGIYLRRYANTSNDFFMAGRDMTAWVAGLSFLSANLGAIELMGWAASTYQYGILAAHFYWIAAFPSMIFLGLVMMPFYYISKTHSVPGYLQLRYGEATRALSGISFAVMTVLMSGINMYAMALVMKVVLGWNIHFSIWVSSLTVAVYVALGGLYSAIFNEVLQFFLIWLGALVIPVLGMIEVGGWSGLKARIFERVHSNDYVHLWSTLGSFSGNPMGVHWTGIVFGLGGAIAFGYWTTDFLVVQRAMAAKDLRSAQLAPIIASYFKMVVPVIVILPGLLALAVLPYKLVPESAAGPGMHSYNEVLPLMLARYCGPGLLGLGITALIAGFMSRHGRQRERFCNGVDLRHLSALYQEGNVGRALRQNRALVHDPGRVPEHRNGVLRHQLQKHHGLHAGAGGLLHRAAVRHSAAGDGVEAGDAQGRFLGIADRYCVVCRDVCRGQDESRVDPLCGAFARCQGHGRERLSRAVVAADLHGRDGGSEPVYRAQAGVATGGSGMERDEDL